MSAGVTYLKQEPAATTDELKAVLGVTTLAQAVAELEKMFDEVINPTEDMVTINLGEVDGVTAEDEVKRAGGNVEFALAQYPFHYFIEDFEERDEESVIATLFLIVARRLALQSKKIALVWRVVPQLESETDYDTKVTVQKFYARCAMI